MNRKAIVLLLLSVIFLTSCKQPKIENKQENSQPADNSITVNNPDAEDVDKIDLESKINEIIDNRLETLELNEETKTNLINDISSVVEENIQDTISELTKDISYAVEKNIQDTISKEVNKKVNSIEANIESRIQSRVDVALSKTKPTVTNITNVTEVTEVKEEKPQTVEDGTSIPCNPGEAFDWIVNHKDEDYNFHVESFKAEIYNVDFSESSQGLGVYSQYKVRITYSGTTDPSLQGKTIIFSTMSGLGSVGDSVSMAKITKDGTFTGEKEIPLNFIPDSISFMDITIPSVSK